MKLIKRFFVELEEIFFEATFPFYREASSSLINWLFTVGYQALVAHILVTWAKRLIFWDIFSEPVPCNGPIFFGLMALSALFTIYYSKKAGKIRLDSRAEFDTHYWAIDGSVAAWVFLVFAGWFTYAFLS